MSAQVNGDLFWLMGGHVNEAVVHLLKKWAGHMAAAGCAKATVQTRVYGVHSLARICDPIGAVTDDVVLWLGECGAAWTRTGYWHTAKAWFAWLIRTGVRTDDPTSVLKAPRAPKGIPRPVPDHDVDRVLAVASGRTRSYVQLSLYAGLRVAEVARMRGEDIRGDVLRVQGKGGRDDHLPLHPRLRSLSLEMPRRGWWFPSSSARAGHVNSKSVSKAMRVLFDELGVDATAHGLRHTFVTGVYRSSGRDLLVTSQLARHSSVQTTSGYAAVDVESRRAAVLGLRH